MLRLGLMLAGLVAATMPAAAQERAAPVQARQILERLVSFRSTAGQEAQLSAQADYIVAILRAGGVAEGDVVRIAEGGAPGLLIRIPGSDARERGVGFAAHMDVVDARPGDWRRDPFVLVEEGGTLFGRGVADNKAGVAAMLATILRFHAEGLRPRRTLVFILTGDEETTGATSRALAAHPWVAGLRYIVNTDDGGGALTDDGRAVAYAVQGAEKTYASYRLTATNPGGHSSTPRDDNAITDLAQALVRLSNHRFPVMTNAITLSYLRTMGPIIGGETGRAMTRLAADPRDAEAAEVLRRVPEQVGRTRTTCVATRLDAGHADNALPVRASAIVNCRIFPGVTVAAVQAELQRVAGDGVRVEASDVSPESPVTDPIPEVMAAIERSVRARHPDLPVTMTQASGATDGLYFRIAGVPTLASSGVFSVPGSSFAHGVDENMPAASFAFAVEHIHALAVSLGQAGARRR